MDNLYHPSHIFYPLIYITPLIYVIPLSVAGCPLGLSVSFDVAVDESNRNSNDRTTHPTSFTLPSAMAPAPTAVTVRFAADTGPEQILKLAWATGAAVTWTHEPQPGARRTARGGPGLSWAHPPAEPAALGATRNRSHRKQRGALARRRVCGWPGPVQGEHCGQVGHRTSARSAHVPGWDRLTVAPPRPAAPCRRAPFQQVSHLEHTVGVAAGPHQHVARARGVWDLGAASAPAGRPGLTGRGAD